MEITLALPNVVPGEFPSLQSAVFCTDRGRANLSVSDLKLWKWLLTKGFVCYFLRSLI